MTVNAHTDL